MYLYFPSEMMMRVTLKHFHGASSEKARELAHFYFKQTQGEENRLWKRAFIRRLQSIFSTPLDEEIGQTHNPTLIFWGLKDRLIGKHGGEILQRSIPGSRLEAVRSAGHFPQFECPAYFNTKLAAFLAETRKADRL